MDWWALSNASSIVQISSAVHEIFADKAFTATDGLISQSFVVAFVHPIYMQITLIWGFPVQLSLWKSVHWLWRYKLNKDKVCDKMNIYLTYYIISFLPESSTIFYCGIWLCDYDCDQCRTVTYDIILILILVSKIQNKLTRK